MVDNIHHDLCKLVVAQICRQLQWDSLKVSAHTVLADLLERYIKKVGRLSVELSGLSNSSTPTFDDVLKALQFVGSDFHELEEFLRQYKPPSFKYDVTVVNKSQTTSSRLIHHWDTASESEEGSGDEVPVFDDNCATEKHVSFLPAESSLKRSTSLGRRFSTTHAVRAFRGIPKLSRTSHINKVPVEKSVQGTDNATETEAVKFPRIKFRLPAMPVDRDSADEKSKLVDVSQVEEDIAIFRPPTASGVQATEGIGMDIEGDTNAVQTAEDLTRPKLVTDIPEINISSASPRRCESAVSKEEGEICDDAETSKEIRNIDECAVHDINHSTPVTQPITAGHSGNESSQDGNSQWANNRLSLKIRFKPIAESQSPLPEKAEVTEAEAKPFISNTSAASEPPVNESPLNSTNEFQSSTFCDFQEPDDRIPYAEDSATEPVNDWYNEGSSKPHGSPTPPPFQLSPPQQPFKLSPPTPPPVQEKPRSPSPPPPPQKLGLGLKLKIKLGGPPAPPPAEPTVAPGPAFMESHSQNEWSEPDEISYNETHGSGRHHRKSSSHRKRKQDSSSGGSHKKRALEHEV